MAYNRVTLPANCHKDDKPWLTEQLQGLHPQHQHTACVGYNSAFNEAYANEPVEHKKSNIARRTANLKMMSFVRRASAPEKPKPQRRQIEARKQAGGFSLDDL